MTIAIPAELRHAFATGVCACPMPNNTPREELELDGDMLGLFCVRKAILEMLQKPLEDPRVKRLVPSCPFTQAASHPLGEYRPGDY